MISSWPLTNKQASATMAVIPVTKPTQMSGRTSQSKAQGKGDLAAFTPSRSPILS